MTLKEMREEKSITQWDLRLLTGIHQTKISLIERGYVVPNEREKIKIAKALGLNHSEVEWGIVRKGAA